MGSVLFLLVPITAGFSIAMVSRGPNILAAAAALSLLSSLFLLIALGQEGVLCAVLAFPIIVFGLVVGVGIGVLFRRLVLARFSHQNTTAGMLLLMGPILIVAAERIETPRLQSTRIEVVQTTVRFERFTGGGLGRDSLHR